MLLFPYNFASQGCKNFANALGAKRIKRIGSKFKGNPAKVVINWGCAGVTDEVLKCEIINHPNAVNKAGNKLLAFKEFLAHNEKDKGLDNVEIIQIPLFTEDKKVAASWFKEQNDVSVVCRTVLRGHSGEGIVISDSPDTLVDAPLYVKYIKKTDEFRLHVLRGKVFDIQRKMRNKDVKDEDVNWKVRNHDNGFIFGREGVEVSDEGKEQAIMAVNELGLDFGAVDLIYNKKEDKYYVIEVNTAPGLTGTTLDNYVEAFKAL